MSAVWVQTSFRKWRSWEMTIRQPCVVPADNPAASGPNRDRGCWWARRAAERWRLPKRAWASSTRTFWPPCSSAHLAFVQRFGDVEAVEQGWRRRLRRCSRLRRRRCLRVRRGACRLRRSSRVGLGSRAFRAPAGRSQRGALPMMTVSMTRKASKANWSWRRTPIFLGRVTEPLAGSISPVRIFMNVDLPAPFGPVMA